MTAKDRLGFPVEFGDYVMVSDVKLHEFDEVTTLVGTVARIVKLSETPKGVAAVGAYVDLVGTGRVSRIPVDLATSRLVMRSNGDSLVGDGAKAAPPPPPHWKTPATGGTDNIQTTDDAAAASTDAATKNDAGGDKKRTSAARA